MVRGTILSLMLLSLILGLLPAVSAAQERPELFQEGQQIYNSNCADCHRSNGRGLPNIFPALKGSSFVVGDPGPVIQIILDGRKSKIGQMPAWKDKLQDQQIAAVVNFIRNNWGNKAEAVTAAMVANYRK